MLLYKRLLFSFLSEFILKSILLIRINASTSCHIVKADAVIECAPRSGAWLLNNN